MFQLYINLVFPVKIFVIKKLFAVNCVNLVATVQKYAVATTNQSMQSCVT